jgi:hypothetical protein
VLWGVYLASGGEFLPTSLLTHVGGLVVGGLAVLFLGLPQHSWWRAILAFLVLQQLCRFAAPTHANIDLAHSVWPGWETIFPPYLGYQVFLLAVGSASFALVEWLTRLLIDEERRHHFAVQRSRCMDWRSGGITALRRSRDDLG